AEHTIASGGIHQRTLRVAGDVTIRWSGKHAHRIELTDGECLTLFITGPAYRTWGFHCTHRGWVHHKDFAADDDPGAIGKGCEP
ncbi:MAG: hypothetical protein ACRCV9_09540, partial [Burkholderiaceae bacterium]